MFEPDQPRLVEGMTLSADTKKLSPFFVTEIEPWTPIPTLEEHPPLNLGFPPLLDSLLVRFISSPRPSSTL